jgi:hypothetical protein
MSTTKEAINRFNPRDRGCYVEGELPLKYLPSKFYRYEERERERERREYASKMRTLPKSLKKSTTVFFAGARRTHVRHSLLAR